MLNPRRYILLCTLVTAILLASMAVNYCDDILRPSHTITTASTMLTQYENNDDDQSGFNKLFFSQQINGLTISDLPQHVPFILSHKADEDIFRLTSIYFDIFVPPQNVC